MSENLNGTPPEDGGQKTEARREFLQSLGKWSGAAIAAAVAGVWFGDAPSAEAGAWINRRFRRGGAWVNRRFNRVAGWINRFRRVAGWVNRRGGWINGARGGWINRRRVVRRGSWINRW